MNIVSIILIAVVSLFTVIGAIVGAVKGFTNVKSWAVELLLTGAITIAVSGLVSSKTDGAVAAIVSLSIAVALICAFMLVFAMLRKALNKKIEKRKELSYYKQYDEREDNTEQILQAIGTEDKNSYNKLTKKKFKQSGGVWSVLDRVFGAVCLALKGAVITGLIIAVALIILDFTRLPAEGGKLFGLLGGIYQSGIWVFFKNYILDFIAIGLIILCIKNGFSSGISSSLWSLLVLGLIIGAGALSYYLAFNAQDFIAVAGNLEGKLAGVLEGAADILNAIGLSTLKIAQLIIGTGMFLLMLVAVILIAVFVPKLIDRARDGVIFRSVDGVFGAIVLTTFTFGLLFVVGAFANGLHDLAIMDGFNSYFQKSGVATYIYDRNLLNSFGVMTDLPFKEWLQ